MKIGLALGAGAARGWTHIGIIKALEKLGVKIDVVAGCSIGAYVGAADASGKVDELQEWACSLSDWQVLALMGVFAAFLFKTVVCPMLILIGLWKLTSSFEFMHRDGKAPASKMFSG